MPSADRQQRRQPLIFRRREQAICGHNHVQGGENRPTSDLNHVGDLEGYVPPGFAFWRVNEPNQRGHAIGVAIDTYTLTDLETKQQAVTTLEEALQLKEAAPDPVFEVNKGKVA